MAGIPVLPEIGSSGIGRVRGGDLRRGARSGGRQAT